jgi:hypothetical protein
VETATVEPVNVLDDFQRHFFGSTSNTQWAPGVDHSKHSPKCPCLFRPAPFVGCAGQMQAWGQYFDRLGNLRLDGAATVAK